jgi:uncharacterized protein (DUF433 family)
MGKRQIKIREALADVRSGMTDAELMDKYQLAAKGLQSLFAKLVDAKLITIEELERRTPGFMGSAFLATEREQDRWKIRRRKPGEKTGQPVNARAAVTDIRSGMSDSDLMHKYKLTSRGLQNLFDQLIGAKLINKQELDQRNVAVDSTVDLKGLIGELSYEELVRELEEHRVEAAREEAGMATTSIEIPLAEVEQPGTQDIAAPGAPRKRLPDAKKVLGDVRSGLTDGELMDKYGLTYPDLEQIFNELLTSQAATRGELYGRSSFFLETVSVDSLPESSVHYLAFPIPISDAMNPKAMGRLRTLGETEVGTVGIEAQKDEYRTLVVFPEKFVEVEPITFDAMCVWSKSQPEGYYATFRITYITRKDLTRLRSLMAILTLGQ